MASDLTIALVGVSGVALGSIITGAFGLLMRRQEEAGKALDRSYDSRRELYAAFYRCGFDLYDLVTRVQDHTLADNEQHYAEYHAKLMELKGLMAATQLESPKAIRDAALLVVSKSLPFPLGNYPTSRADSLQGFNRSLESFAEQARKVLGHEED
ncbi:hypothetical protein [Streptomyces sp. NBC_00588]|uniref:hypothetical protein n=1 Tax=Streptomyces sp. NBC_00588 TaxID=2975784 RepID=UPI002E817B2A|nr:hypothetical protein [Streptomyces sp. NBC_00588]WUB35373.1 hypothetical protein OHN38_10795 [Streptomyces sp. NBC_00588]